MHWCTLQIPELKPTSTDGETPFLSWYNLRRSLLATLSLADIMDIDELNVYQDSLIY